MRETIIETESMARFACAMDEVMDPLSGLSGFLLAYGQAGRGKSVAASRYHREHGGAYLKVWQGWSQSAFLQRLLYALGDFGEIPRYTGNKCKELIVDILEKDCKPLFIDEADRLRIERVEDLRDINEATCAPVVLIGEEGIFGLLAARRRIWSRVVYEIEFPPISAAETAVYAQQSTGLEVPIALAKKIVQKTEGDFRLVRNMMLLLEKTAKASEKWVLTPGMLETAFAARSWRRK